MNIRIKESVGPRCIVKDDGQHVYDMIHEAIKNGENVSLDFSEVTQFAFPFFNFAIGQLLKDISVEQLQRLLRIEHLVQDGRLVVERVIDNASQYHTDVNHRAIVDSILEQQAKESEYL